MAGCKRCALKWGKGEREKEEKKKGKRRKKWGSNFFYFFFFFYKSTRRFFHMRSGHFSNKLGKLYLDLVDYIRYCLPSNF